VGYNPQALGTKFIKKGKIGIPQNILTSSGIRVGREKHISCKKEEEFASKRRRGT